MDDAFESSGETLRGMKAPFEKPSVNSSYTTTTRLPLPSECTSVETLNLTESWRNNYNSTDLKNDDRMNFVPS